MGSVPAAETRSSGATGGLDDLAGPIAESLEVTPSATADLGGGLASLESVRDEIGASSPALVIFFSTNCPRSVRMFPQFVRLASGVSEDTSVLAYSTWPRDVEVLPGFLAASGALFDATVMEPWPPGEFGREMAGVGLNVGPQWQMPLVAVLGEGGAVLGQWEAVSNLGAVESALRAGGMLR